MLHRYEIISTDVDQNLSPWLSPWAIVRERYMGRDWPRFWRASWAYDGCIDVYQTREDAERAFRLLPGVLKDGAE